MISEWLSTIAHPVLADWVTVGLYLLAASLSARAAGYAALRRQTRERLFWRIAAVLLVISAANELLDLQTLLTLIGRVSARANGWYTVRREVQYAFLLALAGAGLLAALAILRLIMRAHPALKLAYPGLLLVALFVFLRAASIHHVDRIFTRISPGFRWAWLAEMSGVLIITAAAALYCRPTRSKR